MTFNVAERIRQVREVEAKCKAMEAELAEKLKPLKEFAQKARGQLLQYLNETQQKSSPTIYGTAYILTKTTYRVLDKEAFMRHVIGTEDWGLITWAAAGIACETFIVNHNGDAPPGVEPNTIRELRVLAPPKPRARRAASTVADTGEQPSEHEDKEAEAQLCAEAETREENLEAERGEPEEQQAEQ